MNNVTGSWVNFKKFISCKADKSGVEAAGIEHRGISSGKVRIGNQGGAKSSAFTFKELAIYPELAKLIDAWSTLPEAIRAGILAMVRASGG